jgi:L-ascorbate metabolism protein UlaG (beta-lactamase superfamily)
VDPWLTGPLEFPPGPWFFRGELPCERPAPEGLDLLLLTQGLDDHCHPASLALLPNDLPVVGSPSAAAKARGLGFRHVHALKHGDCHRLGELRITATAGAPVPQVENGYLLEHPSGRLYLEPHGYLAPDLPAQPLDAVITPVVDLGLPLAGAFGRASSPTPCWPAPPAATCASAACSPRPCGSRAAPPKPRQVCRKDAG